MHPYGSKKITGYDTEPRIKAARALVKREGKMIAEEQLEAAEPGGNYCNGCVPRGCSCVDDPNEPCCEYMELE